MEDRKVSYGLPGLCLQKRVPVGWGAPRGRMRLGRRQSHLMRQVRAPPASTRRQARAKARRLPGGCASVGEQSGCES